MPNSTPTRLVIVAFTAAIIIILAIASRRESDPCAWNINGVPLAKCAVVLR